MISTWRRIAHVDICNIFVREMITFPGNASRACLLVKISKQAKWDIVSTVNCVSPPFLNLQKEVMAIIIRVSCYPSTILVELTAIYTLTLLSCSSPRF